MIADWHILGKQHKEKATPVAKATRGRPRKDDIRVPKESKLKGITQQLTQSLAEMLVALPSAIDRGTKCNAQGYKTSWNGYKLHIDTADCGIAVSALLTSASVHDSQTAIPLGLMSQRRVTNCYDLMDAAYCSEQIREHSKSLGHVPLIDHNPPGGEKIAFDPAEAERYKELRPG
jgi:Transposase DDE domain